MNTYIYIPVIALFMLLVVMAQNPPIEAVRNSKTRNSSTLDSACVHLIHLACTDDAVLGEGFQTNISLISRLFGKWAKKEGLGFSETVLSGKSAHSDSLSQVVKNLDVAEDDVIIFYYSGHAINDGKFNEWPSFLIPHRDMARANLLNVHQQLQRKRGRLVLSFADCCNFYPSGAGVTQPQGQEPNVDSCTIDTKQPLKHFLSKASGEMMVCSSSAGQYAFTEKQLGGVFTNKLVDTVLDKLELGQSTCWEDIFSISNLKMKKTMTGSIDREQNPQYQINVKF